MEHDDDLELLGAYALGALDEDERDRVDALLARSPAARAELARYEHALGALTDAEAATPLPPGSWERTRAALRADVDDDAVDTDGGFDDADDVPALPELRLPPREPVGGAVVVPLRPRRRGPLVLAAAAALVAAGLAVGSVVARPGRATLEDAAAAARADGSSRRTTLAGDGVAVEAVVDADGNGYLFAGDLAALPEGRVYQLWSLDGPAPVSLGVLGRDPTLVTFPTGGQVTKLALSTEASPGVTAPTNPIAAGDLS